MAHKLGMIRFVNKHRVIILANLLLSAGAVTSIKSLFEHRYLLSIYSNLTPSYLVCSSSGCVKNAVLSRDEIVSLIEAKSRETGNNEDLPKFSIGVIPSILTYSFLGKEQALTHQRHLENQINSSARTIERHSKLLKPSQPMVELAPDLKTKRVKLRILGLLLLAATLINTLYICRKNISEFLLFYLLAGDRFFVVSGFLEEKKDWGIINQISKQLKNRSTEIVYLYCTDTSSDRQETEIVNAAVQTISSVVNSRRSKPILMLSPDKLHMAHLVDPDYDAESVIIIFVDKTIFSFTVYSRILSITNLSNRPVLFLLTEGKLN